MAARLALASTSPRRVVLLRQAGIEFVLALPGPEPEASGPPRQRARERALSKARGAIAPANCSLPMLGVDTVVDLDGRELGKPADGAAAAAMLDAFAGRIHEVHTAHCLIDPVCGAMVEELVTAAVEFAPADAAARDRYLASGDWRGKAGGYGIQDATQEFARLRDGAFDTVVGLHVAAVVRLLAWVEARH